VGEKEAAGTGSVNGGLGLEELPSAIGIPDPKSGRSSPASNVERNLQNDVDFQQARSSSQ
jgi:hypothetical protein